MNLTPIRVRGKRKRPSRAAAAASSAQQGAAAESAGAHAPASLVSASSGAGKRPGSRSASPSAAPSSAIKRVKSKPVPFDRRFPFEILEYIFLLSGNHSLPQSSPRLGMLLSGRRTLLEMTIDAFRPTWDKYIDAHGKVTVVDIPATPDCHLEPDAKSQTATMACAWAKIDLLLDAEHLWVQRNKLTDHMRTAKGDHKFKFDMDEAEKIACVVNLSRMHDVLRLVRPPPEEDGPSAGDEDSRDNRDNGAAAGQLAQPAEREEQQSKPAPTSVYAWFTVNQLEFMVRCHRRYYVDAQPEDDPVRLLSSGLPPSRISTDTPTEGEVFMYLNYAAWFFPKLDLPHKDPIRHVHPGARIPEWLLLGGGPYYSGQAGRKDPAQNTREHRDGVRRKLRTAFDTFYWVVQGRANLSPMESWEVMLQGVKNLLEIDVAPREEEERAFIAVAEQEARDKRLRDWGPGGVRSDMVHLGYSLDSLVMGYLSLFHNLGLFGYPDDRPWQLPAKVMKQLVRDVAARAKADPGFRATCTFRFMQRAALTWWSAHEIKLRDAE